MQSILERKLIIGKDGIKKSVFGNPQYNLIHEMILSNNKLLDKYNESDETIEGMFLLEKGYMYFDLDVNQNYEVNLILLYYSKNMSEETKDILFDLLNEETRNEKVKELFNDKASKNVLSKTNDIRLRISDLYNHLEEDDKEKVEEEIFDNGIEAGSDLIAKLLPWNKNKTKKLIKE